MIHNFFHHVLSRSDSIPSQARLWEAGGSREQLLCLKGHQDVATSVTFSPDGQRLDPELVVAGPGHVFLTWETATELWKIMENHFVSWINHPF